MKRDMDLVRDILFALLASDKELWSASFFSAKYSRKYLAYHFLILDEAGLLVANVQATNNDPYNIAVASHLTREGTDFLDAEHDESIRNMVRSSIGKTIGGTSFQVFKVVAPSLALEATKASL